MGGVRVTVRLQSLKHNSLCLCALKPHRWPGASAGFCVFSRNGSDCGLLYDTPRNNEGQTIEEIRSGSQCWRFWAVKSEAYKCLQASLRDVNSRFVLDSARGPGFGSVNKKVIAGGNCPLKLPFFSPREG